VDGQLWKTMLQEGVNKSFNQITVDGDTSTNDTVLCLASGAAGGDTIKHSNSEAAQELKAAVTALLQGLAKAVAWDGEGATCLMEVTAGGAPDDKAAAKVAKSIAASSLVKAAVFGHDPNWGRIACAAGYSGVKFNQTDMQVKLGDILLMQNGQPLQFDKQAASGYLKATTAKHGTVCIDVQVGKGHGKGIAWGCDLSYDYVKINAEYTT
jgi:glutamate N-acetyltransferase/amino-acid N-acetyltransferase